MNELMTIFSLFVTAGFHQVHASLLSCYSCNTCDRISKMGTVETCPSDSTLCFRTESESNGEMNVTMGCGNSLQYKRLCSEGTGKKCYVCRSDLCNMNFQEMDLKDPEEISDEGILLSCYIQNGEENQNSLRKATCSHQETFCYKIIIKEGGIWAGCGTAYDYRLKCDMAGGEDCYICRGDLCNKDSKTMETKQPEEISHKETLCYSCDSCNKDKGLPQGDRKYCTPNDEVCYTIMTDTEMIMGCTQEKVLEQCNKETHTCYICNGNACNANVSEMQQIAPDNTITTTFTTEALTTSTTEADTTTTSTTEADTTTTTEADTTTTTEADTATSTAETDTTTTTTTSKKTTTTTTTSTTIEAHTTSTTAADAAVGPPTDTVGSSSCYQCILCFDHEETDFRQQERCSLEHPQKFCYRILAPIELFCYHCERCLKKEQENRRDIITCPYKHPLCYTRLYRRNSYTNYPEEFVDEGCMDAYNYKNFCPHHSRCYICNSKFCNLNLHNMTKLSKQSMVTATKYESTGRLVTTGCSSVQDFKFVCQEMDTCFICRNELCNDNIKNMRLYYHKQDARFLANTAQLTPSYITLWKTGAVLNIIIAALTWVFERNL